MNDFRPGQKRSGSGKIRIRVRNDPHPGQERSAFGSEMIRSRVRNDPGHTAPDTPTLGYSQEPEREKAATKEKNEKLKEFTDYSFSTNRGGSPKIVINDEEGDVVGKRYLSLNPCVVLLARCI